MKRVNLFDFTRPAEGGRSVFQAVYFDDKTKCAVASNRKVVLITPAGYSENYGGRLVWRDGMTARNGVRETFLNERFEEYGQNYAYSPYKNLIKTSSPDRDPLPSMKDLKKAVADGWRKAEGAKGCAKAVYIVIVRGDRRYALLLKQAELLAKLPSAGTLAPQDRCIFSYRHDKADGNYDYYAAFYNEDIITLPDGTADGVYVVVE